MLFSSNASGSILMIDLNVSLSDSLISVQEDLDEKTARECSWPVAYCISSVVFRLDQLY